jgi:hypothetical protein
VITESAVRTDQGVSTTSMSLTLTRTQCRPTTARRHGGRRPTFSSSSFLFDRSQILCYNRPCAERFSSQARGAGPASFRPRAEANLRPLVRCGLVDCSLSSLSFLVFRRLRGAGTNNQLGLQHDLVPFLSATIDPIQQQLHGPITQLVARHVASGQAGVTTAAMGMSSKPTMAMSSGTRRPRLAQALSAPTATRSL